MFVEAAAVPEGTDSGRLKSVAAGDETFLADDRAGTTRGACPGSAPKAGRGQDGLGPGRRTGRSVFMEEKPMTFEKCQSVLVAIRRQQGTRCPLLRVDFGGAVFQGRLTRSDCDPERRRANDSPYGVLVLEGLGLARGPETFLQIADIPEDGIRPLNG
jgi:hypothetical protein